MYSYSKLKGRIVELYGTQTGFAKRLGISKNSISKKLAGKQSFRNLISKNGQNF